MRLKRPKPDRERQTSTPADEASVSFFSLGSDDFVAISLGAAPAADLSSLSAAETGVLSELAAGRSNLAIAQARGTSLRTVTNQVSAIFRKLGVRSRAELALLLAGGGAGARKDGGGARSNGAGARSDSAGARSESAPAGAPTRKDAGGRGRAGRDT